MCSENKKVEKNVCSENKIEKNVCSENKNSVIFVVKVTKKRIVVKYLVCERGKFCRRTFRRLLLEVVAFDKKGNER